MSETILITSGKGGVGKSTVACLLGLSLAEKGKNVLILELDCGLRGLDVMLTDTTQVVFSLGDVLTMKCKASQAINTVKTKSGNLHYMSAPADRHFEFLEKDLRTLFEGLADCYDFLILDCAAGLGNCFDVASKVAQKTIAVTCCDMVSVRDAAAASQFITGDKRLVINKFRQGQLESDFKNLDEIVDLTHMRLLGVIPFDKKIMGSCCQDSNPCMEEANDISDRLLGKAVPLNIKRLMKT